MKRLMGIAILMVFLLGSNVFAQEPDKLKVEDVIEKAVKASKKLKLDDLNVENSKKVFDAAQKDADKVNMSTVENSKWNIAEPDHAYVTQQRKDKEVTPEQRKYEYELSKKTRILDEEALKQDVYNTYYALIKVLKDIDSKKQNASLAAVNLNKTSAKYKKGLVSKNEYQSAQLSKKDAEMQYKMIQKDKKRLVMKLYTLMREGYQPDIKPLNEELSYKDMQDVVVEDAIKKALENRMEVFKASEDLRIKQLEYDIVLKYYEKKKDDVEYKDTLNNLEDAKINLETQKDNVEHEIRSSYNDLLNLLDTIEINKVDIEKSELNYNVVKLKNSLGMALDSDVEAAGFELNKAKIELNKSILDYIILKNKFEAAQGVGPGVN